MLRHGNSLLLLYVLLDLKREINALGNKDLRDDKLINWFSRCNAKQQEAAALLTKTTQLTALTSSSAQHGHNGHKIYVQQWTGMG